MKLSYNQKVSIFCIILFRLLDWISTYYVFMDQENLDNELNIIVRIFNINSRILFLILEITGVLTLLINYLYFVKNKNNLFIQTENFGKYLVSIFFKDKNYSWWHYLKKIIKNFFITIGQVIPKYVILTSSLFIVNNILVYKAEYNNYYYRLYFKIDSYLSFEKIIYIIPIIILITLILLGLYSNFKTIKTFRADI